MELLGSLGNFYVMLLFFFLIGGSGLIAFNLSKGFWEKSENFLNKKGGKFMNKWIKLAVTSFAGILIASFALGITSNMSGADPNSAHSAHGAGQMTGMTGMTAGQASPDMSNYGQMTQNPMSYDARLYQLQVNMMQLQQQLSQIIQMHAAQYGNYPGMGGYPSMSNPNMGNMNSMNGMSNMNNMSNSGSMSNSNNMSNMSGGGMNMM